MSDSVGKFNGLPGVKAKSLPGYLAKRSAHSLLSAVCGKGKYRVAACAGDLGAITVWRDDLGFLRAERSVHCITRAATSTITKRGLAMWLREQLPLLTDTAP